ncbi:FHA domain-containing protein [Saccharopolyspora hattusasensis]|uniref:FHA domain-containing protein n=1 Tax=Saccharopolyspora hattusasensis TaxID=1128679 RepID=UPI003D98BAAF
MNEAQHNRPSTGDDRTRPAVPVPDAPLAPAPTSGALTSGAARLILSRGPQAGTVIPVATPSTTVGRSSACDVVLDSPTVSRCHAEIRHDGRGYTIVDNGSLNGTYLNRRPVDRAPLTTGDEIWIGTFRFTFHAP